MCNVSAALPAKILRSHARVLAAPAFPAPMDALEVFFLYKFKHV